MRNQRGKSQVCAFHSTWFTLKPIPPLPWCFQSFCVTSKDLLFQDCLRCHFFSVILSFYWSFILALSSLPFPDNLDHVPYFSPAPLNLWPTKCAIQISSLGHDKDCAVLFLWIYTLLIHLKWKVLLGWQPRSVPWAPIPIFHGNYKQLRGVSSFSLNLIWNFELVLKLLPQPFCYYRLVANKNALNELPEEAGNYSLSSSPKGLLRCLEICLKPR